MSKQHPGGHTSFHHDDHKVQREFERLYRLISDIQEQKESMQTSPGVRRPVDDTDRDKDKSNWALTVLRNRFPVQIQKKVQALNFESGYLVPDEFVRNVEFTLTREECPNVYKSHPDRELTQVNIRGRVSVPVPQMERKYLARYWWWELVDNEPMYVGTLPRSTVLDMIVVTVLEEFNNDYKIKIGTPDINAKYLSTEDTNMLKLDKYRISYDEEVLIVDEGIYLRHEYSEPPTQGRGVVFVYFK